MRTFWSIVVGLIAATALVACSSTSTPSPSPTSVSVSTVGVEQFREVTQTEGTTVVDVRTPAEFAAAHLPGAVNIDVESPSFSSEIAGLDKSATYAVYCRSGNRSAIATQQMLEAGFTDVYDLAGGMQSWTVAGQAIE